MRNGIYSEMLRFTSKFVQLGKLNLPEYSGTRIMMMPINMNDTKSLPDNLERYRPMMEKLFEMSPTKTGVGYLTIDEKLIKSGSTHRRSGKHVDGIYQNGKGGWGGNTGSWGANGLLTVSSELGCRVFPGTFIGKPGPEGECDHLIDQITSSVELEPGTVYWLDPLCVHESIPMTNDTFRTFVRLSMPSDAPWFEGYDHNPLGIKPTGPILSRREFMNT